MKIINLIKACFQDTQPEPTGDPRFFYWRAAPRDWRWHLKAANHEIMASGEGYVTKQGVLRGIDTIKAAVAIADVMER